MSDAGAFGQPVTPSVACPRRPVCDAPPTDWSIGIRPWFCSNEDTCNALSWNPDNDRATNLLSLEAIHDPTVCPLGGQPTGGVPDPRCTCYAEDS